MGKRISALNLSPRGSCGEFVRNVLYGTRKAAYGKIQRGFDTKPLSRGSTL